MIPCTSSRKMLPPIWVICDPFNQNSSKQLPLIILYTRGVSFCHGGKGKREVRLVGGFAENTANCNYPKNKMNNKAQLWRLWRFARLPKMKVLTSRFLLHCCSTIPEWKHCGGTYDGISVISLRHNSTRLPNSTMREIGQVTRCKIIKMSFCLWQIHP